MAQQIINVGVANKGNGDPLRSAFVKANSNFTELYQLLQPVGVDTTPPASPAEGSLWFDTVQGRLYIQYSGNWVDASPDNTGILVGTVPPTSKGTSGDVQGMLAFSATYLYYCKQNYTNGVADIWVRVAFDQTPW